jgi:hypothetical protein
MLHFIQTYVEITDKTKGYQQDTGRLSEVFVQSERSLETGYK